MRGTIVAQGSGKHFSLRHFWQVAQINGDEAKIKGFVYLSIGVAIYTCATAVFFSVFIDWQFLDIGQQEHGLDHIGSVGYQQVTIVVQNIGNTICIGKSWQ